MGNVDVQRDLGSCTPIAADRSAIAANNEEDKWYVSFYHKMVGMLQHVCLAKIIQGFGETTSKVLCEILVSLSKKENTCCIGHAVKVH